MAIIPADRRLVHCRQENGQDLLLQCCLGAEVNGRTLLTLLAERFSYYPENRWRELIAEGLVMVNGVAGDFEQVLARGDRLGYRAVDFSEPETPTYFESILEIPDLLLVGKPAGTPVTRTGLIVRNTLVNLLRNHFGEEIHPLHRLDRETSGLILCARSREACRQYQNQASALIAGKYYLAVVRGRMAVGTRCSDQPLAPRDDSLLRCRMWPEASGKPCRTIFHTLVAGDNASLVLAELVTGRRHQIRAHLAHLGYPVLGDKIYGHGGRYYLKRLTAELTASDYRDLGAENHLLHAWAMRLAPPELPTGLYFSELFSADFRRYLGHFPGWESLARERLAEISGQPGRFLVN